MRITADKTFGFNALRNSVEDFDSEEATNRPRQWNNFSAEEIANRSEAKAKMFSAAKLISMTLLRVIS